MEPLSAEGARLLLWLWRVARRLKMRSAADAIRYHYAQKILWPLHWDGVHSMREFAITLCGPQPNKSQTKLAAQQLCTNLRELMGTLVRQPEHDIHCCLKMFPENEGTQVVERVEVWARSMPLDGRAQVIDPDPKINLVSRNSRWAALLGEYDGATHWHKNEYTCFSCNDLEKHKQFKCDIPDWERYFKSALVFTLRYCIAPDNQRVIGFLQFDSPGQYAFHGMPDIFEYAHHPNEYRERLRLNPVFHLGAIFADVLSMFVRPFYEELNGKMRRK
ncbi:MAG: hypothetical protein ACT4QB_17295 [Gammaproteobacteria bacterium]